jgi:hypothetical protein
LLGVGNITIGKLVEPILVVRGGNSIDGHKDSPRNKPDRKENTGHHTEEPYEEEGVHSIVVTNIIMIRFPDIQGPTQQTTAHRLLPLAISGEKIWLACYRYAGKKGRMGIWKKTRIEGSLGSDE